MYIMSSILGFASLVFACGEEPGASSVSSTTSVISASSASVATSVSNVSRNTAPSGALVVVSGGAYSTIHDAVDALDSSSSAQSVFIEAGTYEEQVYIQKLAGLLTIYGQTDDTASYSGNKVTITSSYALADESTDDETATLRVWSSEFKMLNVDVKNTYGQPDSNGQALALSARAENQGYYGCGFYGYQDTILAETGAQLYAGCYIEGATDFIFGQTAQA